jgi:hypothetical protein
MHAKSRLSAPGRYQAVHSNGQCFPQRALEKLGWLSSFLGVSGSVDRTYIGARRIQEHPTSPCEGPRGRLGEVAGGQSCTVTAL